MSFVILTSTACGNGGNKENSSDTTTNTGPAPDNSNATNPSLADTVDHRDTTH
jgi:hypothetical protein